MASLVQQLAGQGRPEALKWLNLGVKRAKEPLNFRVRNLGCSLYDMVLISVSDAAYGAMPGGSSQGGNLVMLAHPDVLTGTGPVCILEGNSAKVQRVVRCSMSAEISALATAYEHGDFVRTLTSSVGRRTCQSGGTSWRPTPRRAGSEMAGDGLTKCGHNKVLTRVISSGEWALADNAAAQELRRLAAAKRRPMCVRVSFSSGLWTETVHLTSPLLAAQVMCDRWSHADQAWCGVVEKGLRAFDLCHSGLPLSGIIRNTTSLPILIKK